MERKYKYRVAGTNEVYDTWKDVLTAAALIGADVFKELQPSLDKPIKVCPENAEKIEVALKNINGKATEHTYTKYASVENLAKRSEKTLGELLENKKYFKGAVAETTSGTEVAKNYSYRRRATTIVLSRRSSAWWLVDVREASIDTRGGGYDSLFLTKAQDERAIEVLRRDNYQVLPG